MPKTNLTDASIQRLSKPESGVKDYWDKTQRGLGLRVSASGRRTFNVQVKVLREGRRRDTRIKLGVYPEISLAEARIQAGAVKAMAAEDLDPVVVREEGRVARAASSAHHAVTTFAAVRKRFFDTHVSGLRPSTAKEYRRVLTRDFAAWDGIALENIGDAEVKNALGAIEAPYMANRARAYLRVMFNWAVDEDIIKVVPRLKKANKEESRSRVLTDEEIAVLWSASDDMGFPFGPLFKVLLLTGQRIGEVSGMRWRDVDLEKMVWTLPKSMTKNKEPHTVPLSNQVAEILKTLPRIGDEFAFTTTGIRPVSGFSKAKLQIDAAAEVAGWRWHDLRRTFATYAAEQLDVQQAVTEAILNHKSGSTAGVSGVYNRARYTRQKTEALQAWANLLDHITGVAGTDNVVEMR